MNAGSKIGDEINENNKEAIYIRNTVWTWLYAPFIFTWFRQLLACSNLTARIMERNTTSHCWDRYAPCSPGCMSESFVQCLQARLANR